ncbi:viroplasmin family protein [Salibacterium halotolerans]|uniref:Ribonuclease H n=1 Tax=Salibacterium halotolerans TaxID=1884432 RepID=A0A1I5RHJ4_9BACI|nr:ribonuclease H family protein [Salibacterium halotolerans]SFP58044.1 ribonuclease HI [Salibacterium halotolerans]
MAAKKKYYVVWKGRNPGIYDNWQECEKQVKGFAGASFKSFRSKAEAEQAFQNGGAAAKVSADKEKSSYIEESISVDVGSHGNPGFVEYKGVYTKTGDVVFAHPGINKGTNNLGEFLAVVDALKYVKENNSDMPVYSDSDTAILWVKKNKANSSLARTQETEEIWRLVGEAEEWLRQNKPSNRILKWNTKAWGEIKADYGRK